MQKKEIELIHYLFLNKNNIVFIINGKNIHYDNIFDYYNKFDDFSKQYLNKKIKKHMNNNKDSNNFIIDIKYDNELNTIKSIRSISSTSMSNKIMFMINIVKNIQKYRGALKFSSILSIFLIFFMLFYSISIAANNATIGFLQYFMVNFFPITLIFTIYMGVVFFWISLIYVIFCTLNSFIKKGLKENDKYYHKNNIMLIALIILSMILCTPLLLMGVIIMWQYYKKNKVYL